VQAWGDWRFIGREADFKPGVGSGTPARARVQDADPRAPAHILAGLAVKSAFRLSMARFSQAATWENYVHHQVRIVGAARAACLGAARRR